VFHRPIHTRHRFDYQQTIDARNNYWGSPGTPGVAAGKIRDYNDYRYLLRVDYLPVLQSNTSLVISNCPAGWFQVRTRSVSSQQYHTRLARNNTNRALHTLPL